MTDAVRVGDTAQADAARVGDTGQADATRVGDTILVVDFGSQYTQLIARRVREQGVYCEIRPYDVDAAAIRSTAPRGVILSGGPETVTEGAPPRIPNAVFDLGVPVLGICYGMQAMAAQLGGSVEVSARREFGRAAIRLCAGDGFLHGLGESLDVWMSHGDKVSGLPPGFACIASSGNAPIAAMANAARGLYGVQFHPEVTHTNQGKEIVRRFVRDIAGCAGDWTPGRIAERAIAMVRDRVGDGRVILGLSGGVDSSVVAALLSRAIGDRLTCVFVDNGLLRKGEVAEVQAAFGPSNALPLELVTVDAADEFLGALIGIEAPEAKRKAIGETFIRVFERAAAAIPGVEWLAQGTIYPDVIESAASRFGKAHVIKSHHNVGGLPDRMQLELVEPLRDLFKDEVRAVGLELGLPERLVNRHPFPGPGLAVRVLGEVRGEYLALLREADAIYIDELRRAGWYDRVAQAFAVFLPVKSVGVVGDARRYAHVIASARRGHHGLHDRRLGRVAARAHRQGQQPHRQRAARGVPGRLRCHEQAAGDDRVGVTAPIEAEDERWMRYAIAIAAEAAALGEVPVGAVVVRDGAVLGDGYNRPIASNDPTAHAEVVALRAAAAAAGNYRLPGATLYATVEPCLMCAGALVHARIARLVFGALEPKAGAVASNGNVLAAPCLNHRVAASGGILAAECAAMLKDFFAVRRSAN